MLLLAALALTVTRASADTGAVLLKAGVKKDNKNKKDAKGLPIAPSTADSSPQRELLMPGQAPNPSAIFQPSTSMPLTKMIAPILGGVAGAAALAGVITLSVMKKPAPDPASGPATSFRAAGNQLGGAAPAAVETTLLVACAAGDTTIEVASTAGFGLGDTIKIGSEYQMIKGFSSIVLDHPMNTAQAAGSIVSMTNDANPVPIAASTPAPVAVAVGTTPLVADASASGISGSSSGDGSSGMDQKTVLAIACVLVVCGLLSVCIVGLLYFFFGKKKKRKIAPRQEMDYYPEDQQPLNGVGQMSTRVDMAPDLCESQYMQVNVPPLQVAPSQFVANIGSVPTMQNVVPMQTMPPPPPPMAMSYAPQPASGSLFSQQGQSLFAPATQGQSLFAQGSYYQNASPLANTVNALPTQQYVNMPPTIY